LSLFEFLRSWKDDAKITLTLVVQGQVRTLEPETEANDHAKEWQGELRGERVVGPYRAQFADDGDALVLPEVTCVADLLVQYSYRPQRISPGGLSQIARHCVALRRLHFDMPGQFRLDHVEYMRERREGMSCLTDCPASCLLSVCSLEPDTRYTALA
jgi:hypothetical protein